MTFVGGFFLVMLALWIISPALPPEVRYRIRSMQKLFIVVAVICLILPFAAWGILHAIAAKYDEARPMYTYSLPTSERPYPVITGTTQSSSDGQSFDTLLTNLQRH